MLKIKKIIGIVLISLCAFSNLFAKDSKFLIKANTKLYKPSNTDIYDIPKNELIVKIEDYSIGFIEFDYNKYGLDILVDGKIKLVSKEDIVPNGSVALIDKMYVSNDNDDYVFLPTYYLDVIAKKNRELLREYDSESVKFYGEPNEYEDGWYKYILQNVIISNSCISFGREHLYVENINSLKNGFSVETLHYTFMKEDGCKKLNFIFDGDYLNVYIEGNITPIYSFFKIKKSDYEQLEKFIFIPREYFLPSGYLYDNAALEKFNSENAVDVKSFIWPRHADGSCDYEDNKKTTSTSQSSSTPKLDTTIQSTSSSETNVAVKKTMTVSENLKLRSGEATITQVLTVMSAGTKVKILELGKEETIDGINSNWVKVEVISGRDRDGKDIKKKTTGWCYGGYLE